MEYKTLNEIATNFRYGRMPDKSKLTDSGIYPVWSGYRYVGYYNEKNINKDEIVVVARGVGGTGDVKICKEDCFLTNLSIAFNVNEDINPLYVYYYYQIKNLRYLDSGSAQSQITINDLKNVKIPVPSKIIQDKIVEVLNKLDQKIDLNNKINNNLHEYAKELFKNWFIDFNYPNSNEDRIESELGLIPKGWSIGYFDDGLLTEIIKSGVSKFDGEKKYIATADVDDSSINSYTVVDYNSKPSRANMTPIADSIWFAKMEGSKKNILVTNYTKELIDDYIFSTGFMGIKCLNNSTNYLWEIINSEQFQLKKDSLSTGTLMAGVSNTTIKNYKYLIPTKDVLDNYNEVITSINKKIYNNQVENKKLSQLRDTLLPKLMNGEINLENIEI